MQAVTTIGLDIAKSVFRSMAERRPGDYPSSVEAALRFGVLAEAGPCLVDRGLRCVASLVAPTAALGHTYG